MAALTECVVRTVVNITHADNTSSLATATAAADLGLAARSMTIAGNSINSVNESYAPALITLTAGNSTSIDLTNGTANKSPTGSALTLARVKIAQITVPLTNGLVNGVFVNQSFANNCLPINTIIRPGGVLFYFDPTANGTLVNSTSKIIRLENLDATNSATVKVVVIGGQT